MGKYQKNIEAARRISVMQYLETYHPGELVRKTDKEYCTKAHSSLVITPSNGLFHWFSQHKGGNNALDYLVKVEGMDFVSAVRLLSAMAPAPVSIQTAKASSPQQHTTRPFELPTSDRNTEAATAYLMHRGAAATTLRWVGGTTSRLTTFYSSIPKLSAWHFALTVMNPAGTLQKLWQKG